MDRLISSMPDEQNTNFEKLTLRALKGLLGHPSQDQSVQGQQLTDTNAIVPVGQGSYSPQGIRIGGDGGNHQSSKVWGQRNYRDYDIGLQLGNRNLKIALRRLRKYARQGIAEDELDMQGTLKATADNAGYLTIKMQPERKNRFKIVMLLDVGGTMSEHAALTTKLFSSAKTEFKNMEFFYFHNCIYEHMWKKSWLRKEARIPTWDILRRYAPDTRIVFVGDATMKPSEILAAGGSVEYNNEEAGDIWLERFVKAYPNFIWLNPEPADSWSYRESILLVKSIMKDRMFPLTIEGLERGMKLLSK